MFRLNYFTPYQSKPEYHEDQLTRAFLVVLRYVPVALAAFMEAIRNKLNESDISFPSYLLENVTIENIDTQVTNPPTEGVTDLIAVMMTDNNWTEELEVRRRKYDVRYDGVIQVGSIIITLENKPCSQNIWPEQISPGLDEDSEIHVYPKGVVLYWPDIISMLGSLLSRDILGHCENTLIDDFLSFVQYNFPLLNPYYNLEVCKGNSALLNLRCKNIMEKIAPDSIRYHRGADYCIVVTPGAVKEIYLRYRPDDRAIYLSLYPGDTMNQAKALYKEIDIDSLQALQQNGWSAGQNLHFSHIQKHLHWSESEIGINDYVDYWKVNIEKISQVNRDETTLFNKYIDELLVLNLITKEDAKALDELFNQSSRGHIRPCPGIYLEYCWPLEEAAKLDKDEKFSEEVKARIKEAFDVWTPPFQIFLYPVAYRTADGRRGFNFRGFKAVMLCYLHDSR